MAMRNQNHKYEARAFVHFCNCFLFMRSCLSSVLRSVMAHTQLKDLDELQSDEGC